VSIVFASTGNGIVMRLFPIERVVCDFFRIAGERLLVYHERTSEKEKKRRKRQTCCGD
jgi:hypothetical protein